MPARLIDDTYGYAKLLKKRHVKRKHHKGVADVGGG